MKIRTEIIVLLLSLMVISPSCKKEEINTITVEGFVTDDVSSEPIDGIQIFATALDGPYAPLGGRTENAGQATTDARGYFKIKLNVFDNAERLDFDINGAFVKEGYTYNQQSVYVTTLNKQSSNSLNFELSPTALLKIKFKNAAPISDLDLFNFTYSANGNGLYRGVLKKESCGTVQENEGANWIGKDVCGDFVVETIAEKMTQVYWNVLKNNISRLYVDSVFVQRGILNEFSINY